ncbi:MAG: polymerase sigma-54 factor, partial [Pseudomonadota bacterium]
MKLSLQLKLGQQLAMTPQLQQAIKLLQLSTLDLQLEIQEALESNPMLEVEEDVDNDEFNGGGSNDDTGGGQAGSDFGDSGSGEGDDSREAS